MLFFKTKKRPWCRRNFFIKKEFQSRFVMRFLGVVMAGSAASGYLMYMMINKEAEDVFYTTHIKLSSTGQVLLPTVLKINFGVITLVLLAIAVITLFITHKVAGPLHRLGLSTERIGRGEFTGDFRLRSNDELKELATALEQMNGRLNERFNELKAQAEEIDRSAEGLLMHHACTGVKGCTDSGDGRDKLDSLIKKTQRFGNTLSRLRFEKKGGQ